MKKKIQKKILMRKLSGRIVKEKKEREKIRVKVKILARTLMKRNQHKIVHRYRILLKKLHLSKDF